MKINAFVFFLKEVIRVDYEYDGKMTYNESNDTNRLDILSQQSISCFSDSPKEKEAFSFFVINCFEIVIKENGVVSGQKAYDKLKTMQSETVRFQGNAISVKVSVKGKVVEMTQEEFQMVFIDFITEYLRKALSESILVYGNSLSSDAVENIKMLFQKRNQFVKCIPFSEFSKTISQPVVKSNRNKKYFRSVRLASSEPGDMKSYFEENMEQFDLDEGQSKFSFSALICRTGDSQYVSLLEDVNVTKVYFPLCPPGSDVINLNIYIKDVMQRIKFVGGIRTMCKRASALPRIVLLVSCKQFKQYKVFRVVVLDIEKHTERSFLFGDWESNMNLLKWDYISPILENNPFFSFIPCVDRVEIHNISCSIYGRIFDLEGKMFYKGEFDNLASINMLSNSIITSFKNDSATDANTSWSVLLCNPQSQNGNDIVVLQNTRNNTIYVGYQVDSQPNGQGYIVNSQGQIVQAGEFSRGVFVKGDWFRVINEQPCILSGSFAQDAPVGKFTVIHRSTNMPYIEGVAKENGESEGTLYKYRSKIFTGTFYDFRPQHGTMFYLNGTKKYEGGIICDAPDGNGTFYFYEDSLSIFEIRKQLQQNTLVPRKCYEGQFTAGAFHGQGTQYSSVGQNLVLYKGEFKSGKFNGSGSYAVSPIAVFSENSVASDWSRESLLDLWESQATSHTIIAFIGTFKNNLPVEGSVYFNDGAIAKVTRDGYKLVGDLIKNHNKCYRVMGKFEITSWDLKFLEPITCLKRPYDQKHYDYSRKGFFDEKTKMISEYVIEMNLPHKNTKKIKHFQVIPEVKSWMWSFGNELPIEETDECYCKILNLMKYFFCSTKGTSAVFSGSSFFTYDAAIYRSGCMFISCLFILHTCDSSTGNKET